MAFSIVIYSITTAYMAILGYYAWAWWQCKSYNYLTSKAPKTMVSVIIPARNEQDNIGECLQSLMAQQYPGDLAEILLVDDCSTDATVAVAKKVSDKIKIIDLSDHLAAETNAYKKKAIEVGVAQATGELIVTVDADCIAPKLWLQTIVAFYEEKLSNFIVMPVYVKPLHNLVGIFQSLDFAMLQGITAGAVNKGLHSMCNGANLAYTKKAFNAVNGFEGINTIASGDDMLLMHKIAKIDANKVHYLKHENVIMQTKAVPTIAAFFNQRIRWASKATHYQDKSLLPVLTVVYFFNVALAFTGIVGIFRADFLNLFLGMMVAKIIAELLLIIPVTQFYSSSRYLIHFVFFQPFHVLYTIAAGFLGKFGSYTWKERKVK